MKVRALTGKIIGEWDGKVFKKTVKKEHLYRSVGPAGGYGIDTWVVEKLPLDAIIEIKAPKRLYVTTAAMYKEKGVRRDHGYGDQLILPVSYFDPPGQARMV